MVRHTSRKFPAICGENQWKKVLTSSFPPAGSDTSAALGQPNISEAVTGSPARVMWFDAKKCERLIEALRLYRYTWDEKLATFKDKPVHDWTSHAADAFRYLAEGLSRGAGTSNFDRPLTYAEPGMFV